MSHRSKLRGYATIVATLACAAPAVAQAAKPRASEASPCRSSQLVAYMVTDGPALGTVYVEIAFTNIGPACTLSGFPGVSAIAPNGKTLDIAHREPSSQASTVTLPAEDQQEWHTAYAEVAFPNVGFLQCKYVNAVALKVYAPNDTTAKTVPMPFEVCPHHRSFMSVGPTTAKPAVG